MQIYAALEVTQSKIVFSAFSANLTCISASFKYLSTSSFPPPGLYSPNSDTWQQKCVRRWTAGVREDEIMTMQLTRDEGHAIGHIHGSIPSINVPKNNSIEKGGGVRTKRKALRQTHKTSQQITTNTYNVKYCKQKQILTNLPWPRRTNPTYPDRYHPYTSPY